MEIPDSVLTTIERALGAKVHTIIPVGGGCISHASRVSTDDAAYFLKWAVGEAGETFTAEGHGLSALARAAEKLVVPRPLMMRDAEAGEAGLLLMGWIDETSKNRPFWENLGVGLATLHRGRTSSGYGFEKDNYIGRLPQSNTVATNWIEFFTEQRIMPQVRMSRKAGRWSSSWDEGLEGLLRALPAILPASPHPSLVHGDLWTGNVLAAEGGEAAIVDPAAYRGDREVDLAMSELFGGFDPLFYDAYSATWPVDAGYAERRDVYNLYHLINHLNHFGSSYAGRVAGILNRFR